MYQANLDDAIAARDAAMNQVAANNEEHNAGWQRLALAFMRQFCRTHASFFPWEVGEAFDRMGYVQPTDPRAWGQVYRKAAKEGLIKRSTETAQHPYRHATMTLGWNSLIYKGGLQ